MNYYVVIDTNVIVSALISNNPEAATVQLVARMLSGEITPVYSDYIMNEYREVLRRKKFRFDPQLIDTLLAAVEKFGLFVTPSGTEVILPDMKDVPFYEALIERRKDNAYLVTGNLKHFPVETFIVTARQMLNILDEK